MSRIKNKLVLNNLSTGKSFNTRALLHNEILKKPAALYNNFICKYSQKE